MDWAKNVRCKNITIYGFCRYENKGCAFNHEKETDSAMKDADKLVSAEKPSSADKTGYSTLSSVSSGVPDSKSANSVSSLKALDSASLNSSNTARSSSNLKKFNVDTQSFKPSLQSKFSKLSTNLNSIPSFVPLSSLTSASTESLQLAKDAAGTPEKKFAASSTTTQYNFDSPSFQPMNSSPQTHLATLQSLPPLLAPQLAPTGQTQDHGTYAPGLATMPQQALEMFYTAPNVSYPLQYHLYAPNPLQSAQYLDDSEKNAHSLFISNDLRELLLKKNEATLQTLQHSNLPDHVSIYHTLVPLDRTLKKSSKNYGVPSSLYKVFSNADGNPYTLRRLEGLHLTNEKALTVVARWKKLGSNANIVKVHEAFTSLAFGDSSLYYVQDFHPLSKTLRDAYGRANLLTESSIWSIVVQISNALAAIHANLCAARLLTMDKVIVVAKDRIKLSGCGIVDILRYDTDIETMKQQGCTDKRIYAAQLQLQDLWQFGVLILELVCMNNGVQMNPETVNNHDLLALLVSLANCSSKLKDAMAFLLGLTTEPVLIAAFTGKIAPYILDTMNRFANTVEYYEAQLSNEIENDRLVRLLTKINFIIERPEHEGDLAWSETGERYPIKLFRDYVFHRTDQEGKPVVDLAHVLTTLNKLDVGLDEKILLVSRDESSCIIASYKELKECIDTAFRSLIRG